MAKSVVVPAVVPVTVPPVTPPVTPPPFETPAQSPAASEPVKLFDYFAGQVLMGAFANRRMTQLTNEVGQAEALRITAEIADQMADEMMRRRGQ